MVSKSSNAAENHKDKEGIEDHAGDGGSIGAKLNYLNYEALSAFLLHQ